MHRFFVSPSAITDQGFSFDDPELCHQLFKVLKIKPGKAIVLCDNTEHEYRVELTAVSKTSIAGKILEKKFKPDISSTSHSPHGHNEPNRPHEPFRSVHLFVPPLKNPSRWEWMLEKCTEIGVASFTPLLTERTEVRSLRKIDRLERIIKEAAELSGRTKLSVIHEPVEFKKIIGKRDEKSISLIATLYSATLPLSSYNLQATTYNLYLGPVGDFTPDEVRLAIDHGFQPISLGSQILRTETAAVVGAALLLLKYKNIIQ